MTASVNPAATTPTIARTGETLRFGGALLRGGIAALWPQVPAALDGVTRIDLTAVGGYNLRNSKGMIAWGRLGYHYDVFSVADVTNLTNNTAKLPSESLSGLTLGASMTAPTITPKIGALIASCAFMHITVRVRYRGGGSPNAEVLYRSYPTRYRCDLR